MILQLYVHSLSGKKTRCPELTSHSLIWIFLYIIRRETGAARAIRVDKLRRNASQIAVHAREGVHQTEGAGLPRFGHDSREGENDSD